MVVLPLVLHGTSRCAGVGRRKERGGLGARRRANTFPRPFASGMEVVRVVDGYTLWQ
ncbi:unnamed protein product [Ectocarpus sp. 8 AP-2014]